MSDPATTLIGILLSFNFISDTNYVLSSYKTEPCKRPPRLCRQGYACPQYHNSKVSIECFYCSC